jgi:hypothetical protein
VIQTSIKSGWLLALCGVLYATGSFLILSMGDLDGSIVLRTFVHSRSMVSEMGALFLAASACTIAAGLWSGNKGNSWLLVLNGIACSGLGVLMSLGASRPIAFRTIALVIAAMAVSMGLYELAAARELRGHLADMWFFIVVGMLSGGFAVVFLAFVFRWIKLDPGPSSQTFHWLGSYFGFSALCMLFQALRCLRPPALIMPIGNSALPKT